MIKCTDRDDVVNVPFAVVIPRHTLSELGFKVVSVFLTGAAEEIEGWLVRAVAFNDSTEVAARVADPEDEGVVIVSILAIFAKMTSVLFCPRLLIR